GRRPQPINCQTTRCNLYADVTLGNGRDRGRIAASGSGAGSPLSSAPMLTYRLNHGCPATESVQHEAGENEDRDQEHHADDAPEIDHRGPVLIRRDYAQAQVPIPNGMPIRYQAMKNSVQTITIAMKNGIISAITVPIPDRLS